MATNNSQQLAALQEKFFVVQCMVQSFVNGFWPAASAVVRKYAELDSAPQLELAYCG
nr:hypothetical protein [Glutamicibacter nicotianae]